ncbi:MAG TPA: CPBP family intramembrane glutamic endopeptidase [Candidatus Limnocylindrales bacterium]|nr:CPBP family intramembrane glutamic endopeptidase [Candidatus Limnocylindrales bacterium]
MTRLAALPRLLGPATAGPRYQPSRGDREEIRVAGLALPVRATVALFVATGAYVADATGSVVADAVRGALGPGDPSMDQAVTRAVLFGAMPLVVVLLGFRESPARYGVTLGEWRWGLPLLLAGLVVMTPVIWFFSTLPEFVSYYKTASGPLGEVLVRNVLELVPAEFLLRGFLLFVLLRRIGPLAIVVVQVPFVLTHIGKPDIELWSTFLGGSIFAWLDWRTRSIVWSALGHVYVLTLMVTLAGAAPG